MAFPDTGNPGKEASLIDEINRLRLILKDQCRENYLYDIIRTEAFAVASSPFKPPKWITPKNNKKSKGIPTLFLSDWHWGEVVNPEEVNNINEYNLDIAQKRAKKCFSEFERIFFDESTKDWEGLVILLGGDMVSGDIHEELALTNENPILDCVLSCSKAIASGIELLSAKIDNIIVFGVVGNHGRSSKKPRFKQRVITNYDWMIYSLVERYFEKNTSIEFNIPKSSDCYYRIFDTKYLLTHGDQLGGKGTDPILGAMASISQGDNKRRQRQFLENEPYDVLVCGHWHQLGMLPKRIINGSLKGVDEFSYGHAFAPEKPQQASWITEPDKGITSNHIIICE